MTPGSLVKRYDAMPYRESLARRTSLPHLKHPLPQAPGRIPLLGIVQTSGQFRRPEYAGRSSLRRNSLRKAFLPTTRTLAPSPIASWTNLAMLLTATLVIMGPMSEWIGLPMRRRFESSANFLILLDKCVVYLPMYVEPLCGYVGLTCVPVLCPYEGLQRGREVRILPYDERSLSSELKYYLGQVGCSLLHYSLARGCGTGHGYQPHIPCVRRYNRLSQSPCQ